VSGASASPAAALERLREGVVIPACPLALDASRRLDEKHQRAVLRYYCAAGAGGVAVGVHTTQFEIRDPQHNLLKPVLELAAETLAAESRSQAAAVVRIAGVCGRTAQAVAEAEIARSLDYHAVLLSLAALRDASDDELIEHCTKIAEVIPVVGFYLQPAVGGRILPYSFWRRFAAIANVVGIKIAPFNRYQTIDVIRAVAESGRRDIALYTGNDDNIIADLLTPHRFDAGAEAPALRIVGGLLGQFSVWTYTMVRLLESIHGLIESGEAIPFEMLERHIQLTDANAVIFDAANRFAGCIPGINEVLRRQGLMQTNCCLNPHEVMSSGQAEEIDRVCKAYPWLPDDDFVRERLDDWLR
jgi:hypothetical protein